jgi:hypothetical protein
MQKRIWKKEEKIAINLLYLFRKYPDANRNEITALAGLDPIKKQSGSSLNGGRKITC